MPGRRHRFFFIFLLVPIILLVGEIVEFGSGFGTLVVVVPEVFHLFFVLVTLGSEKQIIEHSILLLIWRVANNRITRFDQLAT